MPEGRDRLSREDDSVATYSRGRISGTGNRNIRRGSPIFFVLEDGNEEGQASRTPFRWRGRAMVGTTGSIGATARGSIGTPRIRRTVPIRGPENLSPVVGSGRGRGSALPTWYPRRPLNDITAVVRAIERRRGLHTVGGLQYDPSISTASADLQRNISMISPCPTISNGRCLPTIGKVPKILLNLTKDTPQKKLLNNIDTVEKVVMEELRKLKRTPSAKKAEREKRIRRFQNRTSKKMSVVGPIDQISQFH